MNKFDYITIEIDPWRVNKELFVKGKDGKRSLSLILFPIDEDKRKGFDTHCVKQRVSKEQREAGVEGPFVGNAIVPMDHNNDDVWG